MVDLNIGVKNADEKKVKGNVEKQKYDWIGVGSLCVGWALTFSVVTASITTSNVAGAAFAPSSSLNTVPLALLIISQSLSSFALPFAFQALNGRLNAYRATSLVGAAASVIAAIACDTESFAALCISSLMLGLPVAAGQSFRFAALSLVSPDDRPQTIGLVLTGGIAGALIGPSTASAAKDLFPAAEFAGVYLYTGCAFLALLGIFCFPGLVSFPITKTADADDEERGAEAGAAGAGADDRILDASDASTVAPAAAPVNAVAVAFSQPSCCAATAVAAFSYSSMSFLMSPTPLAMKAGGFSFSRVSHVITVHMIGMYAPSVLSGRLVALFGWKRLVLVGTALYVVASLVMYDGVSFTHFVVGQMLLGVGWNLCFVAATSELARCSSEAVERVGGTPTERARASQRIQGYNDVVVFAVSGAASILSGAALDEVKWTGMQAVGWSAAAAMALSIATADLMDRAAAAARDGGGVTEMKEPQSQSKVGGGGGDDGDEDDAAAGNTV